MPRCNRYQARTESGQKGFVEKAGTILTLGADAATIIAAAWAVIVPFIS